MTPFFSALWCSSTPPPSLRCVLKALFVPPNLFYTLKCIFAVSVGLTLKTLAWDWVLNHCSWLMLVAPSYILAGGFWLLNC